MGELFERLYLFMTAARSFTGLGLAALFRTGGFLGDLHFVLMAQRLYFNGLPVAATGANLFDLALFGTGGFLLALHRISMAQGRNVRLGGLAAACAGFYNLALFCTGCVRAGGFFPIVAMAGSRRRRRSRGIGVAGVVFTGLFGGFRRLGGLRRLGRLRGLGGLRRLGSLRRLGGFLGLRRFRVFLRFHDAFHSGYQFRTVRNLLPLTSCHRKHQRQQERDRL